MRSFGMRSRIVRRITAGALLLVTAGCGLLDVSDPTAIENADVANATGADLLRRDAIRRLYRAVGEGVFTTGILSDELVGYDPRLDKRDRAATYGYGAYTQWKEVQGATALAIPQILTYGAQASRRAYAGELFAVHGYATLGLAEGFCPGFPIHEIVDFKPVYGPPLSTDEALERALADFDSAGAYAADSARILNLARIGRGRALLGLGRFPEAAETVGAVPTAYTWNAEFASIQQNWLGFLWQLGPFIRVGDREGGNGLDFVAANDPRLKVRLIRTTSTASYYAATKYPNADAPIVIASGLEARLIEAEAALNANDPQWLTILNDLRASQISPAMSPLDDPGTEAARVDLLFRERAFWLYGTAHRLADLRRMIARYGRSSESVFPTGPYYLGDVYGSATSMPFPAASETPYNPAVTGCTDQ